MQYTVYGGYNSSGVLQYVGQTCRELAVRAAEHLGSGDPVKERLFYKVLHNVPDLLTARGSEQAYINADTAGNLVNKIDSIASTNPNFEQAKQQAQLYGAVPAASTPGLGGMVADVVSKLVSPLMLFVIPEGGFDSLYNNSQRI